MKAPDANDILRTDGIDALRAAIDNGTNVTGLPENLAAALATCRRSVAAAKGKDKTAALHRGAASVFRAVGQDTPELFGNAIEALYAIANTNGMIDDNATEKILDAALIKPEPDNAVEDPPQQSNKQPTKPRVEPIGQTDAAPPVPSPEDYGTISTPSPAASTGSKKSKSEPVKLLSSAAFIASYIPPDYLVAGLLQRRFFYSWTGNTGGGKTAMALLFAALVALGRTMDGREFVRGRVLYLAGENPVDVQQRWIAMSQQIDFDADTIDVHFIPGVFSVSAMRECITEQVSALGGVSLVIIDTSAAYFEGDDENDNVQAGKYARMQRELVNLPGGPTVLALCHPPKNATEENLLPRGGGAYLNECDGNLTAHNKNGVAKLHWLGKFRGPDFAPMSFQIRVVSHERLKDQAGRPIYAPVAVHLSETGEEELKATGRRNEDKLLTILADNKGASLAELAKLGEWRKKDGDPNRTLVWRLVKSLKDDKLVVDGRNGLELTDAGKKAVKNSPAKTISKTDDDQS